MQSIKFSESLSFLYLEHYNRTPFWVSQSSLTGESGVMEKVAETREVPTTPLLELKNICFMVTFHDIYLSNNSCS